jgi:hypothetical protein
MAIMRPPGLIMGLCIALAVPACATTGATRVANATGERRVAVGPLLPEYVRQLSPGSAVRIERANGKTLRGVLLKATEQSVVIQARARIPEPPVEVPLSEVLSIVPDQGRANLGRAIAAGAAAGAGTALAVFFIIVSLYAD